MNQDTVIILQHLGFVINLKKIDASTRAENRTFGSENQFCCTRTITKQTKNSESEGGMSKVTNPYSSINFRVDKIGRLVNVNN